MENNELKHWGIKGMKWGQRRYQNKDGTLTPAGKKRYDKEMEKLKAEEKVLRAKARTQAKLGKLDSKREELDELRRQVNGDDVKRDRKFNKKSRKENYDDYDVETSPKKKKRIKDMTDEELRAAINRIDMEKRYADLTTPKEQKKSSKGKEFIKGVFAKTATDLAPQVTKHYGAKLLNKMIGEEAVYANNKKK